MLVKQKEANRQSMLLLQSAEPSIQLLKALEDVAAITKTLEEERLQHQQKVNPELFPFSSTLNVRSCRDLSIFIVCLCVGTQFSQQKALDHHKRDRNRI